MGNDLHSLAFEIITTRIDRSVWKVGETRTYKDTGIPNRKYNAAVVTSKKRSSGVV